MFVKYLIMREYYTNKFEEEMNFQRRLYDKYQRDQNFSYHYDYNRTGTRLQRPVTSKSIKPASANKNKSAEKTTSSSNHKKLSNKIETKSQKTVPKPANNSVLRRATSVQAISKLVEQKEVNKQITNNPLPNSNSLGSVSLISSRRRAAEKPAKKVLSPIRAISTSPENSGKKSEPPRIIEHIQRSVSARPQPLKPILNSESNKSFNKLGLNGFRSAFSKPIEKTVSFEPKHTKRYIPRLTNNKSPIREQETKNKKNKKSSKPTESFDKKNSSLSKTPSFKSVFANPEPKASIKRSESKKQHSHKDKDTHKHSSSSSKNKPSRHKAVIISENKQIKILVPLTGKLLRKNTLNPLNFGPNSYLNSYNQINPYLNAMQYLNQQQAQPYQNINQFYNGYMNNHSFTNIAENNFSYSPTPSHQSDVNWSPQMDYYY